MTCVVLVHKMSGRGRQWRDKRTSEMLQGLQ